MVVTAKDSCNILVSLLIQHQVENVVVSPGSRNTPLILAVARAKSIKTTVVVDERSAAFVALGMCAANHGAKPVALICTSGSALLNYAPAIAEAYYRNLPLVIISADRPMEWIDQDDSQTIRQFEALSNYVKKSYNIPTNCDTPNMQWYVNRIINDALITSLLGEMGPVHINIQLDDPLNEIKEIDNITTQRHICCPSISHSIDKTFFNDYIIPRLKYKRILIVVGFQNCIDARWVGNNNSYCLEEIISNQSNIVLFSESISNINIKDSIKNIDSVLSVMTEDDKRKLCPDIIITFGGAIISRHIKQYFRQIQPLEHWHIGTTKTTIDCFKSLTMRIEMSPYEFFKQYLDIAYPFNNNESNESYYNNWEVIKNHANLTHSNYVNNCNWSDLKAFSIIIPKLKGNIHLSNGTSIRYHQLFYTGDTNSKAFCNRGVSGIDGSTSTAIGHAMVLKETTTLITGDISAQYDISALSINNIPSNFKMIVMCNGGGGIFRFIKSTSELPELDEYFATTPNLPLKELAKGYNFNYFEATNEQELINNISLLYNCNDKPSILAVYTPAHESAQILKEYFKTTN